MQLTRTRLGDSEAWQRLTESDRFVVAPMSHTGVAVTAERRSFQFRVTVSVCLCWSNDSNTSVTVMSVSG
jgi:hypothetical protein